MSKKLFFGMFMAAGMLLMTSCSNDELETAQSGNEARVTFSLGLENNIGTRTRAISDGSGADRLTFVVLDKDGKPAGNFKPTKKNDITFPYTLELNLAKGQEYRVAFWADNKACKAYKINSDATVSVNYDGATNNDETRDAFFKTTEVFKVTGSTSMNVELKRPFAQINVGVTTADWQDAVKSGINIAQSSVVVKNAATSLDLVTGAVSTPVTVSYGLADIPTEELQVDANKDGTISPSEKYHWLSMGYILVNDDSQTEGGIQGAQRAVLENLEFTFKPSQGNDIELKGLTNVPVQRNWRTNILGRLLTGDVKFNITIDPAYDNDYIYPDDSAQELEMAAANGGKVTLKENVELTNTIIVADGKTVTIDLNGYNIVNNNQSAQATTGVFVVGNGSKLTIQGNGIVNGGSGSLNNLAVWAENGSEVNIAGGTFTVGTDKDGVVNSTIYTTGGTINISGGTFTTECDDKRYILNVGQTQGASGTINVTGGTFVGYDPATGDDNLHGSFMVDGYTTVQTSSEPVTYEVVKGAYVTDPSDLETILNQGGHANISTDIAFDDTPYITEGTSFLHLKNNAELKANGTEKSNTQCIMIGSHCQSLTIDGTGTITGPSNLSSRNNQAIYTACDLVIDGDININGGSGSKTNKAICITDGTTTIKNGYFTVGPDANSVINSCIFLNPRKNGFVNLNIYGGVFETTGTPLNDWYPVVNIQDSGRSSCKVLIYGGIFINYDPATGDNTGAEGDTFVAPGYKSEQIEYKGKTAWQVVEDK